MVPSAGLSMRSTAYLYVNYIHVFRIIGAKYRKKQSLLLNLQVKLNKKINFSDKLI